MSKATQRPDRPRKPTLTFWLDEDPQSGEADGIALDEAEVRDYAAKHKVSFSQAVLELGRLSLSILHKD